MCNLHTANFLFEFELLIRSINALVFSLSLRLICICVLKQMRVCVRNELCMRHHKSRIKSSQMIKQNLETADDGGERWQYAVYALVLPSNNGAEFQWFADIRLQRCVTSATHTEKEKLACFVNRSVSDSRTFVLYWRQIDDVDARHVVRKSITHYGRSFSSC